MTLRVFERRRFLFLFDRNHVYEALDRPTGLLLHCDRQGDRQGDRQTDRQTDSYRHRVCQPTALRSRLHAYLLPQVAACSRTYAMHAPNPTCNRLHRGKKEHLCCQQPAGLTWWGAGEWPTSQAPDKILHACLLAAGLNSLDGSWPVMHVVCTKCVASGPLVDPTHNHHYNMTRPVTKLTHRTELPCGESVLCNAIFSQSAADRGSATVIYMRVWSRFNKHCKYCNHVVFRGRTHRPTRVVIIPHTRRILWHRSPTRTCLSLFISR